MINLDKSWLSVLESEFEKDYMKNIKSFLEEEIRLWKTIFPHPKNIFNALNLTKFDDIKVVIIWQDPYHWEWQAHWLSFSVLEWINPPPSLKNIFKEIQSDIYSKTPLSFEERGRGWGNGNLEYLSKQWVLLLNSILTVEANKPASHSKIGWQRFTDEIIKEISNKKDWVIFLLWGNFAKQKKDLIDLKKHFVLESAHPSPFSAYNWFFGCKHFSKTNEILRKQKKEEINWLN